MKKFLLLAIIAASPVIAAGCSCGDDKASSCQPCYVQVQPVCQPKPVCPPKPVCTAQPVCQTKPACTPCQSTVSTYLAVTDVSGTQKVVQTGGPGTGQQYVVSPRASGVYYAPGASIVVR